MGDEDVWKKRVSREAMDALIESTLPEDGLTWMLWHHTCVRCDKDMMTVTPVGDEPFKLMCNDCLTDTMTERHREEHAE